MIEGTRYLFPDMEEAERDRIEREHLSENAEAWFFCVNVDQEGHVCAEMSHPHAIENGQFDGFDYRIFIVKDGEWGGDRMFGDSDSESADNQDFEISVTKK